MDAVIDWAAGEKELTQVAALVWVVQRRSYDADQDCVAALIGGG